jgi:hypothetical protein
MPEHDRGNQRKREETDHKDRIKQKESEQLFDQVNTWGQDKLAVGETPFQPPVERHAAMLAKARYDPQRTSLVLRLQKTYGNAYVQRLLESHVVQAKLTVSQPGDIYEQEAERVSEIVTRNINSQINRQPEEEEEPTGMSLQRQPEEEEEETGSKLLIQRQDEEEEETQTSSLLQRQEEEEEETESISRLQHQPETVAVDLETRIERERGTGQSLSEVVREPMERAFGADFSNVKVHTDTEANAMNQELNAKAFTTGQDIFFRQGEYNLGSSSGQKLIAHELTHVVQQNGRRKIQHRVSKQKPTTTSSKTTSSSMRPKRLFASTKQVESPNPFASISKQSHVVTPTLNDSMAKVVLTRTKSSEVTIQRLSGTLTTPEGEIEANWDGTRISKQFDMEATFSPESEQKYGEYRQYVKGFFSTPSGDLVHNMGAGGTLDRKDYREDGPGQYGHRAGYTNYDAEDGKNIYDQPDRPTGKHFLGRDTPGLTPGGAGDYTMDLSFKGQLIDTRNSQSFVTKYWHVSKTVTKE